MDVTKKALFVDEVLRIWLVSKVPSCKLPTEGSKIKVFALGSKQALNSLPCLQRGDLCQSEAVQSESGLILYTLLKGSKAVDLHTEGVPATDCAGWLVPCFDHGAEY